MDYIDEIFQRADLQQLSGFLLHGAEQEGTPGSYRARMEAARKPAIARLRENCRDERECEEVTGLVYEYIGVVEDVYLEIGLQLGAKIVLRSFSNWRMGERRACDP